MIRAGQKLKEERIKKGLSIEDVEKATKIKASFLTAIEKSEYHKLPSSAYVQGFVRNYAEYLGLPTKPILALFRRDFDEKREFKVLPESMSPTKRISSRSIRVRRTVLVVCLLVLFLIGFIIYQFRFAIINPPLAVDSPKENSITTREVTVTGSSDTNATVTVNNQPTIVTEDGSFTKKIVVFPGGSVITIKAKSRFGKETIVERRINAR
jgi:cytoskeletal protein RodZ